MGKYIKDKKYNFDTSDIDVVCKDGFDGVYFGDGYCTLMITKENLESIELYTHEFTELALMTAVRKCTRKWYDAIKFKHFTATRVAHLISPYGFPNKRTLFPDLSTSKCRKVYKQVCRKLTIQELETRRMIGENW